MWGADFPQTRGKVRSDHREVVRLGLVLVIGRRHRVSSRPLSTPAPGGGVSLLSCRVGYSAVAQERCKGRPLYGPSLSLGSGKAPMYPFIPSGLAWASRLVYDMSVEVALFTKDIKTPALTGRGLTS
jgi:hypothetical protein